MNGWPTDFRDVGALLDQVRLEQAMVSRTARLILSEADYRDTAETLSVLLLSYMEQTERWLDAVRKKYGADLLGESTESEEDGNE